MLQSEEVLFIPSGIVHSISSDKVNSKVLMIKSSNTSEVEYLQESEITLPL
ncbi:hypothetical protein LEP1GSC018_1420 [Leptospira kirschneri str. 2008720114]|nr:hypothetical protein LEP1GSC018_1420 [Leptospira kirschneri str. 2008720114]NDK06263.1 hypothetical protein [Leptospira kirschneri serovar Mozdok]